MLRLTLAFVVLSAASVTVAGAQDSREEEVYAALIAEVLQGTDRLFVVDSTLTYVPGDGPGVEAQEAIPSDLRDRLGVASRTPLPAADLPLPSGAEFVTRQEVTRLAAEGSAAGRSWRSPLWFFPPTGPRPSSTMSCGVAVVVETAAPCG